MSNFECVDCGAEAHSKCPYCRSIFLANQKEAMLSYSLKLSVVKGDSYARVDDDAKRNHTEWLRLHYMVHKGETHYEKVVGALKELSTILEFMQSGKHEYPSIEQYACHHNRWKLKEGASTNFDCHHKWNSRKELVTESYRDEFKEPVSPHAPLILYSSENLDLVERVAKFLEKELEVCKEYGVKVVEHPYVVDPKHWSRESSDLIRRSLDHEGIWAAVMCVDYNLDWRHTEQKIKEQVNGYLSGWLACMNEWEAAEDTRIVAAHNREQAKLEKALTKAYDVNQCHTCDQRVTCLTKGNPREFFTQLNHRIRDCGEQEYPCAIAARVTDYGAVQVYAVGKWRSLAHAGYRNAKRGFTTNPRILDDMRCTFRMDHGRWPEHRGIQFYWMRPEDEPTCGQVVKAFKALRPDSDDLRGLPKIRKGKPKFKLEEE